MIVAALLAGLVFAPGDGGLGGVVQASGEAGNASPAAVTDSVVVPAAGGSITLRGIDSDGDNLAFENSFTSGVTAGAPSAPECSLQSDGSNVCTAEVTVVPTEPFGYVNFTVSDGAATRSEYVYIANGAPTATPAYVVASAGGPTTATLSAVDPDGDTTTFTIDTSSGGTVGAISTPTCGAQADGSMVCTASVPFTSTSPTASFTYRATDGVSSSGSVDVNVNNPIPVAVDAELVSPSVGTNVTLRGVDANGDGLTFELSGFPSNLEVGEIFGTECMAQGDGSSVCTAQVPVTPTGTFPSFEYRVHDGVSYSPPARVGIQNPAPQAVSAELVSPSVGTTVTLRGVDTNGDGLTFEVFGSPWNLEVGAISSPVCVAQGDGSSVCTAQVPVTPTGAFPFFEYRVHDGVSYSPPARVDIQNPAPQAVSAELVSPSVGTTVTLRGVDANGDGLTFEVFGSPWNLEVGQISSPVCVAQGEGSSVCTAEISLTPTGSSPFFEYRVHDGVSYSAAARVDLHNPGPTAIADSMNGDMDTTALTLRGIDPNGDSLSFAVPDVSNGSVGEVSPPVCVPQGGGSMMCAATVEFTPTASAGSITFTVSDGMSSDLASIQFSVSENSVNDPPRASGDQLTLPVAGGTVTLRGVDPEGDELSFSIWDSFGVQLGSISTPVCDDQSDGSSVCTAMLPVTPTGASGYVRYQASDGLTQSSIAMVSFRNEAPTAIDDTRVFPVVGGTVMLRGVDPEGDELSFSIWDSFGVQLGSISTPVCEDQSDGSSVCTAMLPVTPTGASGYVRYQASDGLTQSSIAMVSFRNEAPTAIDDTRVFPVVGGTVMLRGVDPEGDELSFSIWDSFGVQLGSISTPVCDDQSDGSSVCTAMLPVTPTGASGYVRYQASDGLTQSTIAVVNFSNRRPAVADDRVLAPSAGGTLTLRGVDPDGDQLSFTLWSSSGVVIGDISDPECTPSSGGSSVCTATVPVSPTAVNGHLQYQASDGLSLSPTAIVLIDNPSPQAIEVTTTQGARTLEVTLGAVDANGDSISFSIGDFASGADVGPVGPVTCDVRADGSSYCFATVNVNATASGWAFTFIASDGVSSDTATVSGGSTVPTAVDVAVAVPSTTSSITVSGIDPDGDQLTFTVESPPLDATLGPIGPVTCTPQDGGATLCTAEIPFTPGVNDNWSFLYQVSDGLSQGVGSVWVVRQTGADQPPFAYGAVVDLVDGPNQITLQGTDPEGADVTFAIDVGPTNGTLGPISTPVCGGGLCTATVTYTPDGPLLDDSFTYIVNDGTLDSAPATVTLSGNQVPLAYFGVTKIAHPTTALTLYGFDAELATLTFAVESGPSNGSIALDGSPVCDGFGMCTQAATFTPNVGFTGSDSFTFTVSDGIHISPPARIDLTGNLAPYLSDWAPSRAVGLTTFTVTVIEPDSDPLAVGVDAPPTSGSLGSFSTVGCVDDPDAGGAVCTFTVPYTPDPDFAGYDGFTVLLDDGVNPPTSAFISFQVGNASPTAKTDILMTDPDTETTVTVTANDRDTDGDAIVLDAFTNGAHGTAACVDVFGSVDCTYTPDPGFTGLDQFTYTIADALGATATGRVEVTVQAGGSGVEPTECPTVASAIDGGDIVVGESWIECSSPSANGIVQELTPLLVPTAGSALLLTSGDRDVSPAPSYSSGSGRANGNQVRGANDVSVLALDLDIPNGPTCLRFDVVFASEEYPEYVGSAYNDAFLAELDSTTWSLSGSEITAPDNFAFDPDGNVLSINSTFFEADRAVPEPDNGTEYDGATGRLLVQTPITAGSHTLYLTVFDAGDSSLDTAAIVDHLRVVTPGPEGCEQGANRGPSIESIEVTTDEDTPVQFTLDAIDEDGDELTVSVGDAGFGAVTLDGPVNCVDGSCQIPIAYVPNADVNVDFEGVDSFTVTVADGHGGVAVGTVSVTINPVPDPPEPADLTATTTEDTAVDITLVGTDPDGTPVTFAVAQAPANGTIECDGADCTYTPASNFHGSDSFTYTVTSGGETATATVTITVVDINDAPDAVIVPAGLTVAEGSSIALDGSGSTDVDGSVASYLWQVTSGATITNATAATATLNGLDDGVVTVTLRVVDDDGSIDTATIQVTVTNVAPIVDAGEDRTAAPEELISITVGFSDAGVLDTHEGTVDWGAGGEAEDVGAVSAPSLAVAHSYPSEGEFIVEVCLTDDDGGSTCDTTVVVVEVTNVAPTIEAGGPYEVAEGSPLTLAGTVVDIDGNLDPSTILWTVSPSGSGSFGDATSAATTFVAPQDGAYTLTLTAADDLDAVGSDTATVSVANVAPTISTFTVDDGVEEGALVSLAASFSDPGTLDPHTATIDWDAPSTPEAIAVDQLTDTIIGSHVYPQDGEYDVTLCVSDDDDQTCATVTITVVNVAPVLTVEGASVLDGNPFGLLVTLVDPGDDVFTATVDWENDGVDDLIIDPATSPIVRSHLYPGVGTYAVEVCVDDGTDTTCSTVIVQVTAVDQPPIAGDDSYSFPEGTGDRLLDVRTNDSDPEGTPLQIIDHTDVDEAAGAVTCSPTTCTFTGSPGFVGVATFDYTITDGTGNATATVTIDVVGCADLTDVFSESGLVDGYQWIECAHPGAHATAGADLTPVLTPDGTLAQMTTGLAAESYGTPGDTSDEDFHQRYRGAFDASVLRLDLVIPLDINCVAFDVVFASEEFPDFVDKPYNDGFVAELDQSTWTVSGATIEAPDNIAFDAEDQYISVKGSFFDPGRVVTATGMAYNGSSSVIRVVSPITPGAHALYLSVFDGADGHETSAALVENLRAYQSPSCSPGASQPPLAVDDAFVIDEDTSSIFEVLVNDSDPDGQDITILDIVTPPAHGSVIVDADRKTLTYVPTPNYYGPDSFEYSITDLPNSSGEEPVADVSRTAVSIQIDEVNDAPFASPESVTVPLNTPTTIDVLANDGDFDLNSVAPPDAIAISGVAEGPLFGSVTCTETNCTYIPLAGYSGPDRFQYTIVDSRPPDAEPDPALDVRGLTSTATVFINSPVAPDPGQGNLAPVADAGGPYEAVACPEGPCAGTVVDGSASFDPDGTIVAWQWFVFPSPPAALVDADGPFGEVTTTRNGSFEVWLIVYDDEGAWGWDAAPVVAFAADLTSPIDEGSSATITVDFFNPAGDVATSIDWGDGSELEVVPFSIFPLGKSHPYPQDGLFDVTACVAGTGTKGDYEFCDTQQLVVDNVAPIVDASVDRTLVTGGTLVQNRMSFVDPGADSPWTAAVDWGDGSDPQPLVVDQATGLLTMLSGHAYPVEGLYTVTVCVMDDDEPGCDTFDVRVANNAVPIADAGGPYEAVEGAGVVLDASGSSDPDGTVDTWIWSVDDPRATLTDADTATPTFTATDNETFGVVLRVCDDLAACSPEVTTAVTVTNAEPAVDAGDDQVVQHGETVSIAAAFSDAGRADTHTATVAWGDGTDEPGTVDELDGAGTVSGGHAYSLPGAYQIEVCVTDDDGGSSCDAAAVTVTGNPPPVLGAIGDRTVSEGVELSFTATATDPQAPPQTLLFSLDGAPAGATIDLVTGVFAWTPDEGQGPGSYTLDVVVTDDGSPAGEDRETITVTVVEVNVAPMLAAIGDRTVDELAALSFTAEATDVDLPANALVFSLDGAVPAGAVIDPVTGVLAWTPTEAQGPGSYTFDVVVTDDGSPVVEDRETMTIAVNEVNAAPVLGPIGDRSVDELVQLSFTATATDVDLPANALVISLDGAPAGAVIDPVTGVFTWTPTEAQGPGSYTFDVVVIDDGSPALEDRETITVAVNEINGAPVLAAVGDRAVDELVQLSFTATATDADLPANALVISLDGAPAGAVIDPVTGVFTWTPTEAQGPGSYTFDVVVTDDGSPALEDRETITVTVTLDDVNSPPVLAVIGDRTVSEGVQLSFTAPAMDPQAPPQTLLFSLDGAPAGSVIDPVSGVFTWTPTEAQGPGSYTFDVVVTDDGSPTAEDRETITVTVVEINAAPVLGAIGDRTVDELLQLSFTVTATDPDIPQNALRFSLEGAPVGARIDRFSGEFLWIPTETQGPGSYVFDVVVADNGFPALSDRETITITVGEVNRAPQILPVVQYTGAVGAGAAAVTDPAFLSAVDGQDTESIDFDGDGFDWLAPHTFTPIPPDTYESQGVTLLNLDARSVAGQPEWTHSPPIGAWKHGFSDSNDDPYSFAFSEPVASFGLFAQDVEGDVAVLVHLADGTSEAFTIEVPSPNGTFFAGFAVDRDAIVRIDFSSFDYHIIDDVQFGRLTTPPITEQVVDEGSELSFTVPATDPDVPANSLVFSLAGYPTGAVIDPVSGVFAWTPSEAQGPGSYTFDVVVTDDGDPLLHDRETITVTVNEVNESPVANAGGPYVVLEGASVTFDGSGSTDPDGTILSYAWTPEAGLHDPSSITPTFSAVDDAVFDVTLTVTDDGGASDQDSTTVTVQNVAPAVSAGSDRFVRTGAIVNLAATFTDDGVSDTHTASVNWGDGTVEPAGVAGGAAAGSHAFAAAGMYTVTVNVTDDDGGTGSDTFRVSVSPVIPGKLLASDGAAGDWFGIAVAVSGDRVVVAADLDDDKGSWSGSVYVFEPDGAGGWVETKLTASDGANDDFFGYSVAISGDRIVVGAPGDDDSGEDSGSVYVFEPDGAGGWVETKLTASDGARDDQFGVSVAVSGDRIVSGARDDDDNGSQSGSAYVFEPDGAGGWVETKLTASDGAVGDWFGWSVAASGDRVVVGARQDDHSGTDSGSAYVFEADGVGGWVETKLTASDGAAEDWFGVSVAASGDRVVVGARRDDDNGDSSGSVYVFEPNGVGGWVETKLTASDGAANDWFGESVAASGDRVVVGAHQEDDNGDGSGSVYVFEPDGAGGWLETKLTALDASGGDFFGDSVAISGDRLVVGARGDDDNGGESGSTYILNLSRAQNTSPVLGAIGDQSVDELVTLSFTATASDSDTPGNSLVFSLAGAPAGAMIDPTSGLFTWTPTEAHGAGIYELDVVVTDDGDPALEDRETITVTVVEVNMAPVLGNIGDRTVSEGTPLSFTATASDTDVPANTLVFALDGDVPANASIDRETGVFTWTPTEAQGPGSYLFDVVVTDDGSPALHDRETITVTVVEVNVAPALGPIGDRTVDELVPLSITATAIDVDLPANALVFSLAGAPAGAVIDPSAGAFTWTPTEAQGPGTYMFDVVVTDDGAPALGDRETITVTVGEVNAPPGLGAVGDRTVSEGTPLSFTATASDPDLPANSLVFSLAGGPAGASIDPTSGAFAWTPTEAQGPGTYVFDVVVTDDGDPALEDRETITITVVEINTAPVLGAIGNRIVDQFATLSFEATATDGDVPANSLTYSLAAAPAGASIDPVSGAFSWTPGAAQGPGNYTFDVVVTDDGSLVREDRESITVTVLDVTPPVLTVPTAMTVEASGPAGAVVTYTATAVDNFDLNPVVTCSPASGSTFAIGATTVMCVAVDAQGNSSPASSFTVTTVVGAQTFDGYIALVDEILPDGGSQNAFISKLVNAQTDFAEGDIAGAIDKLNALLNQVDAKEGKKNGFTTQQATELRQAINALIDAIAPG